MQPFKKYLSWLSGVGLLVGGLIEGLRQTGLVFDPSSLAGKAIMLAGVVVLVIRNLTEDKDGNGIPDVFERMSPPAQASLLADLKVRQKSGDT
jgi:hypothetical protein